MQLTPRDDDEDGDRDDLELWDLAARARERGAELGRQSADLAARADAALLRFHARTHPHGTPPVAPQEPEASPAEREPSAQMRRRHVVIVNADPAFLDAARVLLQGERYNVTTTNLVARTYELVAAIGADALVIDLTIEELQVWGLLERLRAGEGTRALPVVFTARDAALLDRAERQPWRSGGRFLFLKPFEAEAVADAVAALVGPA